MHRRSQRDPAKEPFWRQAFQDWQASGKTRNPFCADRGLSRHAFDYWRSEIAKRDTESTRPTTPPASTPTPLPTAKPVLMPLRIVSATPLEIRLADGRSVLVPAGFDPKHLQAVLAVLEHKPC
jgi:transposase